MLTLDKIFQAQVTLKGVVRETPLVRATGIPTGCDLHLKPENLQNTGSFKLRGSGFKIAMLSDEEKARGVIACSAGNHAQGVALAASKYGIKSLICLPDSAPISKVEATKGYGAEVCLVEGCYDDAYAKALELRDEFGYTFVHPFDDENVIAGQGTIGLEIANELPEADAGDRAHRRRRPHLGRGLRAEVDSPADQGLRRAGGRRPQHVQRHKARPDRVPRTPSRPSPTASRSNSRVRTPSHLVSKYVDDIALVSEDEIASAILTLIEKQKMIAEGAGAVSVAAAMFDKFPIQGKKVVSLVSGGNIDVTSLSRVIERGLIKSGRQSKLLIELVDKPGQLKDVSRIIADCGGNVVSVLHEHAGTTESINGCYLTIGMETRNHEHVEQIVNALKAEGFKIV